VFEKLKKGSGSFNVNVGQNPGNYSICTENLSRTTKTLTLHFYTNIDNTAAQGGSQIEQLNTKIRTLYTTLNQISTNIEKLRTRETVHYESILSDFWLK